MKTDLEECAKQIFKAIIRYSELAIGEILPEQKFMPGQRVYITKNMPPFMSNFEGGKWATVLYTYRQAHGENSKGDAVKQYALDIDNEGFCAWYHEGQLSLTEIDLPAIGWDEF